MRKIYFWFSLLWAILASGVVFTPAMVRAETYVEDGFLSEDTVWVASSSPYILGADLTVPEGHTLTIGPGVDIYPSPELVGVPVIFVGGQLDIQGTKEKPVNISGIYNINIYHATATISGAHISSTDGIALNYSTTTISSSTISGATNGKGLYVKASHIDITGSRIFDNDIGIFVDPVVPVFLVDRGGSYTPADTGGIGNALDNHIAQSVIPVIPSAVNITNSSLAGNVTAAIKNNEETSKVEAVQNWWGSIDGPATSTVIGQVNYVPWLDHDPTLEATSTVCCSSVLFIPGLEGSWLYRDEPAMFGSGTSTNTLWVPNRNDDVRKLFLNSNGSSSDTSIFSGDPIDNVFGVYSVYGSFMSFMNKLVSGTAAHDSLSKIKEWKSFGYDWRKPINEVVAGAEKRATSTVSLVDIVSDLASHSQTGKVTILAHSNGGLVAKYLVKTLTDMGKADLIDKVISVAVPYIGTPSAISALLHGDHQAIAGGLFMNSSVARQLGQNMSSAYTLLPSRDYFSNVSVPVISFASTTVVGVNDATYPGHLYSQTIKSFKDMSDFIKDIFGTRKAPSVTDTNRPSVVNSTLSSSGDDLQATLRNFSWPESIHRWSIVGLNKETPKTLTYSNQERCANILWFKLNCSTAIVRSEIPTIMGDGTVVAPSASLGSENSSTTVAIDLAQVSQAEDSSFGHVNILESSTTQSVIRSILFGGQTASVADSLPGVSIGQINYSAEPVRLVASVDAQAELHVVDTDGKHTGIVPLPVGAGDVGSSTLIAYEEKIPGSHFSLNSESDVVNNTRISLSDNSKQYSMVVRGGGFGSFTLNVDRVQSENSLSHVEFTDIPMTPLSTATATLSTAIATTSTISTISLDIDGDGTIDFVASSSVATSSVTSSATSSATSTIDTDVTRLELLKKFVSTMTGGDIQYRLLAKRFDNIEDLIRKGRAQSLFKRDWSRSLVGKFTKKFGHKRQKYLTSAERREFVDIIESLLTEFER